MLGALKLSESQINVTTKYYLVKRCAWGEKGRGLSVLRAGWSRSRSPVGLWQRVGYDRAMGKGSGAEGSALFPNPLSRPARRTAFPVGPRAAEGCRVP